MGFHWMQLLIVAGLALLIFGPKRLPEMGSAIGKSITSFRKGIKDAEAQKGTEDHKQLEQKRTELDVLERELAMKKAALHAEESARTNRQTD